MPPEGYYNRKDREIKNMIYFQQEVLVFLYEGHLLFDELGIEVPVDWYR